MDYLDKMVAAFLAVAGIVMIVMTIAILMVMYKAGVLI